MQMLSPQEVLLAIAAKDKCCLIDIREPYELLNYSIDSKAIPMADFAQCYPSLKHYERIVLMCQSGKRAEALANFMETEFHAKNIYVLEGGLNAWIAQNSTQISSY
jgi:rhodanese-related sulfurtransferase